MAGRDWTKLVRALAVATAALLVAAIAQAQPNAEPVKLGLILDMSGIYSDIGGPASVTATRMAVDDFGGKVLGRPIQVLVADHQNKADIAAAIATKWFDEQRVDALIDVAASSPALAVMNVAKQRDRIVMLSGPGASSITNEACTPVSVHYAFNTYALAHTTGLAMLKQGGRSWFFVTADYTFGHQLESDTASVVKASGGEVLGDARVPMGTSDFSPYLLQAQQSKAQVIGFANAGSDLINSVKQAVEFGLVQSGQRLAGLLVYITDIESMGLATTQRMFLSSSFYWDLNDATRQWSKRFFERFHKMPDMQQAGNYSSTMHYLQAVAAAGTTDTEPVMQKMREMPIHDFFAADGHIRPDGLMVHDMYLFQVKSPSESKESWDYYKLIATIPPTEAFQPLSESRCPLVRR